MVVKNPLSHFLSIYTESRQGFNGNAISDQSFVSLLYNNILGRDPDQSGFDYWINEIESGTSRAEILPGFSESQENQINVIGDIANGIEYELWTG